ncbi:MAG: hypothetical protein WBC71_09260 [Salaquimonas sp.]
MTNKTHLEASFDILEIETGLLSTLLRAFVLPTAICIGGLALFSSLPASAQSFSCASADETAEFAICNDENLLALDEKLGEVFATKYVSASTSPQRQAVTREHTDWLIKRNACGTDFTCLNLRYEERLNELISRSS